MDYTKTEQLLRDPAIEPTAEIIADGLKDANDTFIRFCDGLGQHGITLMDWRYYNDGSCWLSKGEHKWTTSRGTSKVKPLFWLSIWDGFFRLAFFFGYDIWTTLCDIPISEETKNIIQNAKPMGKAKKFVPIVLDISSDSLLADAYILAVFKKDKCK